MMDQVDDFARRSDGLLEWYKNLPGANFHPSLEIQDLGSRNAGRGIVVSKDVEADVELFCIPRKAVLTVENSSLAKDFPAFFDDVESEQALTLVDSTANDHGSDGVSLDIDGDDGDDSLDPWLKLIITLIYESFQGERSAWKPYLDVLPIEFHTPMFWTQEQLDMLQASDLRDRIGKAEADKVFAAKLVPVVRKYTEVFNGAKGMSDDEVVALAHRFGSTIMAYAFDLQKGDDEDEAGGEDGWAEDREGQQLGMVPMADMLNADAEFNAHLNHEEDALVMISLRPIKKSEEVLNYYGPLPNSDLLRRYGYVSDKHDIHDVVELPWALILEGTKSRFQLSDQDVAHALKDLDPEWMEDSFLLEFDGMSPDSTGRLPSTKPAVNIPPESLTTQWRDLLKRLRKIKPSLVVTDVDFWAILLHAVNTRQSQYASSLQEDNTSLLESKAKLRSMVRMNGIGGYPKVEVLRSYMALKVRVGEKALLECVAEFVKKKIEERGDVNGSAEHARKKLRTG